MVRQHRGIILSILILLLLAMILVGGKQTPVMAHALLDHSNPPANAVLALPPLEIRLWFTEPLEPKFSRFKVLDADGKTANTPLSQVDPTDAKQMFMAPGKLANGLYTVVWESVSATDGHHATGSFPFTIGAAGGGGSVSQEQESIPLSDSLVRGLNLLSMALSLGSLGFWLFVWRPAIPDAQPLIERRMRVLIWLGWVFLGFTGLLMLMLQVSLSTGATLLESITNPGLGDVLFSSHYGTLWIIRMALWVVMGICLWRTHKDSRFLWLVLGIGEAILLTNSLFTHATATPDPLAATAADWFHLSMTALWVGGLVQLLNILGPTRRTFTPTAPKIGPLIGHFSNFARITMVALILTGLYAAWVEVGSIQALFTTLYGQVLLVKLALLVPLLAVAGVNLLLTTKRIGVGQEIWVGRLRWLVMAEVILASAILIAVGALTSLTPSRTALAQQESLALQAAARPFSDMQMLNNMHIQLDISPGVVGLNTFTLTLIGFDGNPVVDASLIRLRFNHNPDTLGQSELDITNKTGNKGNGTYEVSGSNFSQEGNWRVQVNIQRPNQYDTVVDFSLSVKAAPPAVPGVEMTVAERFIALLLVGLVAIALSWYTLARTKRIQGSGVIAVGLLLFGLLFLVNAVLPFLMNRST